MKYKNLRPIFADNTAGEWASEHDRKQNCGHIRMPDGTIQVFQRYVIHSDGSCIITPHEYKGESDAVLWANLSCFPDDLPGLLLDDYNAIKAHLEK